MTLPRIEVDLGAIRHNVAALRRAAERPVIAVVKAGAYGHGALAVARAALDAGADMLGVVDIAEALALRAGGIEAPILSWMHSPSTDWIAAIDADIDLGVSSIEQLQLLASATDFAERPARVHVKVDTGLGRNGAHERDWGAMFTHLRELEAQGQARFAGLFSHLSGASREADLAQVAAFERARAAAERRGVRPEICHLAATAASIDLPEARYDMARIGISIYGLTPYAPDIAAGVELRPALRLVAPLVRDGSGARVELGAADGLPPLDASHAARIRIVDDLGRPWRLGPVGSLETSLEPLEAECEPDAAGRAASEVTLIGAGDADDASSADEWAVVDGTIGYEIVTRLGRHLDRINVATRAPIEPTPARPARSPRGFVAPRRTLVIDAERLREGLREQADAQDAGATSLDVSANAYGLGLDTVAPLALQAGLALIARTSADVARVRAAGYDVEHDALAPPATRAAYRFDDAETGCVRLVSELVLVKRVGPGVGVSYGHEFVTTTSTTLALVPIGYADALPRRVAGAASMLVLTEPPFSRRTAQAAGRRFPIVGRVAMDQVVLDLGDTEVWSGAPVVVFGSEPGDPSLAEVAAWAGTTPHAFVAALGERIDRVAVSPA